MVVDLPPTPQLAMVLFSLDVVDDPKQLLCELPVSILSNTSIQWPRHKA